MQLFLVLIGFDVKIYLSEIWCENEYRSFSDGSELWDDIASGKIRMEPINCRLICKISFSHVTLRDGTVLQISEDRQKKSM